MAAAGGQVNPIPDWQLPAGVDRGLYDYFRSAEMVADYDRQMGESALAANDLLFCERHFSTPGKLIDLGCGTGRLCRHFAAKQFDCLGVDLSEEMLTAARLAGPKIAFQSANLVGLDGIADASFDYAACLFSTFGMIRGVGNRKIALRAFRRVLRPGGVLVLHAHHRYYSALGWRRWIRSEFAMPQAYGGAALTLKHFAKRELLQLLAEAGFAVKEIVPVTADGSRPRPGHIYGFLVAAIIAR
jgi:ubiquinone/menaquinone biosynthesis C-methylase UbiE